MPVHPSFNWSTPLIAVPLVAATAIMAGTLYAALLAHTAEATEAAVAVVEVEGPGTVVSGGAGQFTATVADSEGGPVAGVTVTFALSGTAGANTVSPVTAVTNEEGLATTVFTSGGLIAIVELTAIAGDPPQTGSLTFNVDDPPTPPPMEQGFSTEPHRAGITITTYSGTVAQLAVDGEALDLGSCFATAQGQFIGYVFGAPPFVNAAFAAQFPAGLDNHGLVCRRA